MTSRMSAADEVLLRALLVYDETNETCRTYRLLPGGWGLLISEERQPAEVWSIVVNDLVDQASLQVSEESLTTSH